MSNDDVGRAELMPSGTLLHFLDVTAVLKFKFLLAGSENGFTFCAAFGILTSHLETLFFFTPLKSFFHSR